MKLPIQTAALLAMLAPACAAPLGEPEGDEAFGGQIGEEQPPPCTQELEEISPEQAVDDVGLSAAEAWETLAVEHPASLQWTGLDLADSVLRLTPAAGDGVVYRLVLNEAEGEEPEGCPDGLLIPATFAFQSDDGLLDELVEVELVVWSQGSATFSGQLDAEAVQGALGEDDLLAPGDGQVRTLLLWGDLDEASSAGELALSTAPADAGDAAEGDADDFLYLGSWLPR